MIHPGHPLMLALIDMILERHANLLRQGAILVDTNDDNEEPSLLFLLTHEIQSGDGQVISKQLQFVRVSPNGQASLAGWAPHLDLQPLAPEDRPLFTDILAQPWLTVGLEQRALALAACMLVPQHYKEISSRHIAYIDKTLSAVHERLTKEIDYYSNYFVKLTNDKATGKDVRLNLENVRRIINDLENRLENRKKELMSTRHIISAVPVVLSGALIIPAGLLKIRKNAGKVSKEKEEIGNPSHPSFVAPNILTPHNSCKTRIEQLAMEAVRRAEEARGCHVVDVSNQKCGWDLTSYPPAANGKLSDTRHIEVKGRAKDATTLTITKNEIFTSWNQGDKYYLAIVLVGEDDSIFGPYYIRHPFQEEPGWGVSSVNYEIKALLNKTRKDEL